MLNINEAFFSAASAAAAPYVSRVGYLESRKGRDGRTSLELSVKTARAWWGDDCECGGTEHPGPDAIKAMADFAASWGLRAPAWIEIEKGWGIFSFPLD
jgi:hypothetical protein